ncbi:AZOBR_p60025 family cell surface glycopolymer formation protein [Spirulina subsalsa]|uniref:AZOBR_p60025 family cell surface glycopolymer formation protein n=1 Tax=Spirulina subsalsa TaxID=54311 RepID=UPI0003147568|nr:hypothetical protein [Spirulina subsalsa]
MFNIVRFHFLQEKPILSNGIIATLVVITVLLFNLLFKFDGNITGFFRIGSEFPLSPYLNPETTFVYPNEVGHDGQQFLTIALDPTLLNPDTINALDAPNYRYRRILYPLLGYVFGLGQSPLIPWAMVLLNGTLIVLLVLVISLTLKAYNHSPPHGLWVLSIPSIWMAFILSTADLLSSFLLVLAVYFYRKGSPILTGISIAYLCLTRENLLIIWLAFVLCSIWERRWLQLLHLGWSWLPIALWSFAISRRSDLPTSSVLEQVFTYPLGGVFSKISLLFTQEIVAKTAFEWYNFFLLMLVFGATFWFCFRQLKLNKIVLICTAILTGLLLISNIKILGYYLDYLRVYMPAYFLLLLTLESHRVKTGLFAGASLSSLAFLVLHN